MSGTHGALRLIERTATRLCDALAGPVQMLNSVLPPQAGFGLEAAADAAKALADQLQLRCAAWGPIDQPVSLQHITTMARGLPPAIAVDVTALPPATVFPAPRGRIVLNLLLLAADSLPESGRIVLAGTVEDLFVRIFGPAAAWPTGLALCLAQETEAQSALTDERDLQMALTALLAHAAGIRLSALFPPSTQNEPAILRLGG